ncbi:hypothetical protein GE278_08035 [Enterobacteriaceae bacterium Kacie_13]|nr:hypothetical protein GE278_08035 [Enterobacteriaceae bacterium Kacie_13]
MSCYGQALGVRVSQDTIKFFDPNFGEFILPYHNGNGENMGSFIGRFLQMIYPKLDRFDVLHFKVL